MRLFPSQLLWLSSVARAKSRRWPCLTLRWMASSLGLSRRPAPYADSNSVLFRFPFPFPFPFALEASSSHLISLTPRLFFVLLMSSSTFHYLPIPLFFTTDVCCHSHLPFYQYLHRSWGTRRFSNSQPFVSYPQPCHLRWRSAARSRRRRTSA